jgi:hypothetical protein
MLISDGNFKVWHYASATHDNASEWEPAVCGRAGTPGAFFFPAERAAQYADALNSSRVTDGIDVSCGSTRVKAMEGTMQGGVRLMDITGIYSLCCPHGIFFGAFDFKGGEKGTYPWVIYQLCGVPATIVAGDSVCRCTKTFAKAEELRAVIEPKLPAGTPWVCGPKQLGVNVMHVQGVRAPLTLSLTRLA